MNLLGSIPVIPRFLLLGSVSLFFLGRFSSYASNQVFAGLNWVQHIGVNVFGAIGLIALVTTFCYQLRIGTDMYGDTRTLLSLLEAKTFTLQDVVGFNDTEPLTRYIHQQIGRKFSIDNKLVYQMVSSVAGGIYCWYLLWFVRHEIESRTVKLVFLIAGLTIGANQLFFGHVEDYTLLYVAATIYLLLAWRYFSSGHGIWWILAVFLIGTKLHVEMVLFAPSFLWLLAQRHRDKTRNGSGVPSVYFVLGIGVLMVTGVVAYFFHFRAFALSSDEQAQMAKNIFLPLVTTPSSLNNYTLQSLKHLNDVLQVVLLTTSPLVVAVITYAIFRHREVSWANPRTLFYLAAALFPLCFVFTVNTILTPQRDWDFLAIAAAPIWLLGTVLLEEICKKKPNREHEDAFVSISLGLGICASALILVNASPEMAHHRIRGLGVAAFKGYHLGSAYLINVGCKNIANIDEEIRERDRIIGELRPTKVQNDKELAFLLYKSGEAYYRKGDYTRAGRRFVEAINENPLSTDPMKGLAVVSLKAGAIDQAIRYLDQFNHLFNEPEVKEPKALWMADVAHYVKFLMESGADSILIVRELDQVRLN